MHKTNTCVTLPLHPDLADMLRAYRETVPHAPDEKVFPFNATRAVFRADRERAGIPYEDARGRVFATHSLRKWFFTSIIDAGVSGPIADALIRHANPLSQRYLDSHDLEPFLEGLSKLPRIWGEQKNIHESAPNALTSGDEQPINHVLATDSANENSIPQSRADTRGRAKGSFHRLSQASGTQPDSRPLASARVDRINEPREAPQASATTISPTMPTIGGITGADQRTKKAVAAILRNVAELLEE